MRPNTEGDRAGAEPIAVIGIGCRFPGAPGPDAFWQLLRNEVDAIREIPSDRPGLASFYHPRPQTPGRLVSRWGGFLEHVDGIDAAFFGLSPREADRMDPQQRLLLEVAWEALEDAGLVPERLVGSAAGVFVGLWINDYEALMFADPSRVDFHMTTGSGRYSASGRLSYVFGLQGPSLTVDTACSSSLVAVHLACQALRSGECNLALAGGANTILTPQVSIAYSQSQMLSPDGRCKFGDARGDGYVRSEGAGIVALKLLSRALSDGDPVQAVILGSAVNNDGKTSGFLSTPGRGGQEDLLRKAYAAAGVGPGRVQYVEAHGTGTSAGDPVELQALGAVLAQGRPSGRPCLVGSVKTNIGHTEGAAGVAGLIKAVLSLGHRTIPASLHFREPNPAVPWAELPLVIPREATAWPEGSGPALAGVSSFGIAGTNAHVVVQEAPARVEAVPSPADGRARLLPLSARSAEALTETAGAFRDRLRSDTSSFANFCYTASVRRQHHDHRLAIVARGAEDAADQLDAFVRGEPRPGMAVANVLAGTRVAFVFPGQGSQWLGMGRQVLEQEPAFRAALERCDHAVRAESAFSVLDELRADPARSRLDQIDVIQPTLFSIQVALAALWRSWGIEPAAVVGHSMGEVAAAHVAGVLGLEDAARVICRRSRLLRRVRGRGAMAVVELSFADAQEAIAGCEDRLSVAVSNSSRSTVLSGDPAALDEVIARLEGADVFCRRVKVDVASHSPQMDELRDDLLDALGGLRPRSGQVPLYSTVTGKVAEGQEMGPAYWVRNLREPVLFSTAVGGLFEDGCAAFVEVSAHPILLPAIEQELQHLGRQGTVLPSLRREEDERVTLLASLGALHAIGCDVDWTALYPAGGRCVRLPSYRWQRERFWYDAAPDAGKRRVRTAGSHPLLGPHLGSSINAGTHYWEIELGADTASWLDDLRVQGLRVVPAAAYVEMALAAAAEAFGKTSPVLSSVVFERALVLPDDATATVQVAMVSDVPGAARFHISSREASAEGKPGAWTLHARGEIRHMAASGEQEAAPVDASLPNGLTTSPASAHYQALSARGLDYGPALQGVERVWTFDGETCGRLVMPACVREELSGYRIHPALLDASFQLLVAAAAGTELGAAGDETLMPVGFEHLQLFAGVGAGPPLLGRARLGGGAPGKEVSGDVRIVDEQGRCLLEARGLRLQKLEKRCRDLDACFFSVEWEPAPRPVPAVTNPRPGKWLVLAGASSMGGRLAARLAERGAEVVTVFAGEDFARVLREARETGAAPWRGIVHLWSLDAPEPREGGLAALEHAHRLGSASVLHLVQAAKTGAGTPPPRLWLVTSGTQPVEGHDDVFSPAQGSVWGRARAVASEHPELRCSCIDLPAGDGEDLLHSLEEELLHDGAEDRIALRGGARYVARLARRTRRHLGALSADGSARLERDATYLVTSGPSPVGMDIATWLVDNGARHIALVGPADLTLAGRERIEALRRAGVDMRLIGADVADPVQVARVLAEVDGTMPALRGVVHAAGLRNDSSGPSIDQPQADAAMPPSVAGAWNLHASTSGRVLDLFVLCSSAGSLPGAPVPPQAAGDAFFGSLAAHRRSQGLPAATIEWGPWSDPRPGDAVKNVDERAYVVEWRHKERDLQAERSPDGPGSWLILADRSGVGVKLATLLRERGETCVVLFADEAGSSPTLSRVLREEWKSNGVPRRGIVHLWSLDATPTDEVTPALLEASHALGCASALSLAQGLGATGAPRLWLVTRGAQAAGESRPEMAVAQAPLWGFGRVLALEQPECWGGLIDLDPTAPSDAARRLFEEIIRPDGEDQVAFRGRERRVARLVPEPLGREAVPPLSEGAYLVTGGLGGVGLQVARWLVERGARHLVLTSRAGLPARSRWDELKEDAAARERVAAVRDLEALGASVTVAAADVSDGVAMAALFRMFGVTLPPLRGVVHAAGILTVSALVELEVPALLDVLRPKVNGAWILHELTRGLELDLFVLFSSAAAVWGSKSLAHYAAANHFLDALAHHRRARGLPALSVNWGWWSGGGITSADTEAFFARIGLKQMPSADSLEALGRLLVDGSVQKTIAAVDWDTFKAVYEAWGPRPLLQELESARKVASGPATRRDLGSLTADEARQALGQILQEQPVDVTVMRFDFVKWCASHPSAVSSPLFARLRLEQDPDPAGVGAAALPRVKDALLAIEPGRRRRELLESHLKGRVAQVLKLAPSRVDVNKPLRTLGLDSLMALELRNRLETDLGLKLSATLVWNHPTVTALVPHLADRMEIPLEAPAGEAVPSLTAGDEEGIVRMLDEIELLTPEEARHALADGMARG